MSQACRVATEGISFAQYVAHGVGAAGSAVDLFVAIRNGLALRPGWGGERRCGCWAVICWSSGWAA